MYQREHKSSFFGSTLDHVDRGSYQQPDDGAPSRARRGRGGFLRWAGWAIGYGSIVFLMIAGSSPPKVTHPVITMKFPEKPLRSGQIILDWPAIEDLPVRHVAFSSVQRLQDLPSVSADTGTGPKLVSTDRQDRPVATEGSAGLAILMWLADIDEISGLDVFSSAIRRVGLETLIQPDRPYTLLAPSNAAFAKLGQDRLKALFAPSGHSQLRALLSNHFIEDQLLFDDFAGKVLTYKSLSHQEIDITATDVIKVGDASMTATDHQAANTVIHVIDDFLTPIPSGDADPATATARADNI